MDAVSASAVVARALRGNPFDEGYPSAVIAVGKAASAMAHALVERCPRAARGGVVIGSHGGAPAPFHWHPSAHPVPDERSQQAARLALATARGVPADGRLLVMVSGGSSALMAESVDGVPFGDKQIATRQLLAAGAEISALNCVRKHLSTVKGGRLAQACNGAVRSWLLSDVVGDDQGVIGSGPTVPDSSTYADALAVIDRYGGPGQYPASVVTHLSRGAAGAGAETPNAASDLPNSQAQVIGGASDALEGAAHVARALGYDVVRRNEPVVGESRESARAHLDWIRRTVGEPGRPVCVLSSGETTVRVTGDGRGGRNQEFALALVPLLAGTSWLVASVGTDGVDGPTDAAGAWADGATMARATEAGLDPMAYLRRNDAWTFFTHVGGLLVTGPSDTNVGDVQVALVGVGAEPGGR
jgi:hydroxypyruvate reductase